MTNTKFQHNADTLLWITKKTIGKSPKHFITDGGLDGKTSADASKIKVDGLNKWKTLI